MKVSFCNPNYFCYRPAFSSNATKEYNKDGKPVCTCTFMFRGDCNWQEMTDYFIRHFKDKDKVNVFQFGSSDGSEAYTKIISLLETKKDVNKFFPIKAFDISEQMVNAANSGMINILPDEIKDIPNFYRYFTPTDKKLVLERDILHNKTYEVKDILKNKVQFKKGDMFEIMKNFKDDSNSLLLCRNVLLYFEDDEITELADLLAEKLKKGSLFVVSPDDRDLTNIDTKLSNRGFRYIFNGVYRKM